MTTCSHIDQISILELPGEIAGCDCEQQLLVVGGIVQAALMLGKQAREQEGSNAVIQDRPTFGRPGQRKARIGYWPGR